MHKLRVESIIQRITNNLKKNTILFTWRLFLKLQDSWKRWSWAAEVWYTNRTDENANQLLITRMHSLGTQRCAVSWRRINLMLIHVNPLSSPSIPSSASRIIPKLLILLDFREILKIVWWFFSDQRNTEKPWKDDFSYNYAAVDSKSSDIARRTVCQR